MSLALLTRFGVSRPAPGGGGGTPGDKPTLSSVTTTNISSSTTAWAVTLPAYSAGDLVLVHIASDDGGDVASTSWPSGPDGETITLLADRYGGGFGNPRARIDAGYFVATDNYAGGTLTVTASSADTATGVSAIVAAGAFDAADPVGASALAAESYNDGNQIASSPAFSANADDGNGLVVVWMGVNNTGFGAAPSGWTNLVSVDHGPQGALLAVRDAAASASESISAAVWTPDLDEEVLCIAYIVRPPLV